MDTNVRRFGTTDFTDLHGLKKKTLPQSKKRKREKTKNNEIQDRIMNCLLKNGNH